MEKGVDYMRLTVTGKNITLTDALKDIVEKKLSKLDKYFVPEVDTRVTLSVQKNRQIIEVTIPFNGRIVRGEESTDDMYASIENVVEKIEKQILKNKTRFERKLHEGSLRLKDIPTYDYSDDDDYKIVKTKKFAIKPMDAEEAVLQMDLLGHNFFVYRNSDSNEVNVVYKRKDGNYGLIEPEF
jgi:putative sigma-54 modulation protein